MPRRKKYGLASLPPMPSDSPTRLRRVVRMQHLTLLRKRYRLSQVRLAALLDEAGLDYVSTSRLTRAEVMPEYAARMCTAAFYITAVQMIKKHGRKPVVPG